MARISLAGPTVVYLQDEWRVVPTVTVNFGLRFDAINGATRENQLSPRINVVWDPSPTFTARMSAIRATSHHRRSSRW